MIAHEDFGIAGSLQCLSPAVPNHLRVERHCLPVFADFPFAILKGFLILLCLDFKSKAMCHLEAPCYPLVAIAIHRFGPVSQDFLHPQFEVKLGHGTCCRQSHKQRENSWRFRGHPFWPRWLIQVCFLIQSLFQQFLEGFVLLRSFDKCDHHRIAVFHPHIRYAFAVNPP